MPPRFTSHLRLFGAFILVCACGNDSNAGDAPDGSSTGDAADGTTPTTSPDATTAAASSTGPDQPDPDSTGAGPCGGDADCGGDTPFCDGGTCVACDVLPEPDVACADADPNAPVCSRGTCMPCEESPEVCAPTAQVCGASGACEPCTAHDQCPGNAACDILIGECFPPDATIYVDGGSDDCPGDGSYGAPYCLLDDALTEIGPGGIGTVRITAAITYPEPVQLGAGQTVAIIGTGFGPTQIAAASSVHPIYVDGVFTKLYVHHVRPWISLATGIEVTGATFYASALEIRQGNPQALHASEGAKVWLVNSTVGSTGGNYDAISIEDASLTVLYSTLYGSTFMSESALVCAPESEVTIRNSIIATRGGIPGSEIDCDSADVTYTATEGFVAGRGNTNVSDFPLPPSPEWFVDFPAADLHLAPPGEAEFADLGQWQPGDPLVDIDGDPRPTTAGAADFVGADVPVAAL